MSRVLTLFRVRGIPVRIHPSWLVIVGLIAWSLSVGYFPQILPGGSLATHWAQGLLAALLLFGSVFDRPWVRLVLSPAREQWLQAAYRRHALKTVVTARLLMGLRAAAFLIAGSARVPFWKFVVADAGAALVGVPLMFGLAYFFTDQIEAIMVDVRRAERWHGLAGLLALAAMLGAGVWRWRRRVVKEPLDEEP